MTGDTMKMLHGGPKGRTLHLVDIENLMGEHRYDRTAVQMLRRYLDLARWSEGDGVLVAAHPNIIKQLIFDRPVPCSLHAVRGSDAADVMLLSHAPTELVVRRFDRLVIGSGDAIFLARARAARDRDAPVLIVARPNCVAARFRRSTFPVLPFRFGDSRAEQGVMGAVA